MTDRDRRSEFLNFMRMPDGSPLATIDVLDYLTVNGFFHAPAAHPDMREVAKMLLTEMKNKYPVFFEDFEV